MIETSINQNLTNYLLDIDNLRNITRFQTAPRNARETVAEHSFYVAAIVLKLHDYFEFNLESALSTALLHDYSEVYISDVPHSIKAANKDLADALEIAESKVNAEKLSEDFAKKIDEFNRLSTAEGCIVNLADVLSVLMYSRLEVKLGNKEYMKDVYHKTFKRINNILEISRQYLKPEYSELEIITLIDDFSQSKIKDN